MSLSSCSDWGRRSKSLKGIRCSQPKFKAHCCDILLVPETAFCWRARGYHLDPPVGLERDQWRIRLSNFYFMFLHTVFQKRVTCRSCNAFYMHQIQNTVPIIRVLCKPFRIDLRPCCYRPVIQYTCLLSCTCAPLYSTHAHLVFALQSIRNLYSKAQLNTEMWYYCNISSA